MAYSELTAGRTGWREKFQG